MVEFHEQIISDLIEDPNGGLVILSSGLCLHKLISSLLQLHSPSQGSLLILSSSPPLKSSILRSLQNPNPNPNFHSEITSDLSATQRLSLYTSGGVLFITARILIVDLLTSRLPTTSLSGLLILNSHSLTETSTEAFIARLLRTLNPKAYIRAFSDKPVSFLSGFAKAERLLKCLYLRKLHLWPRFQVYVSQELEKNPPEVVDIRVPMTAMMKGIQTAIIEVMDACLKEMRKTNKVDVEDLTVEKGLFKSFDEIVRRQLDPIWHTLGKKTKQLVSDLRTLRKLLDYLIRYDAVSYLKYLETLRVSESFRSVWIFAESSHKIFEYAKKRVYQVGRVDGGKLDGQNKNVMIKKRKLKDKNKKEDSLPTTTNGQVVLQEVLEEAPKWKVLHEVLEEIEEERQKQASLGEQFLDEDDSGIVLVACKDERSCMQLEDFIANGPKKVMQDEWEKYLLSKVELQALPKRKKNKPKDPKGFGVLDGVVHIAPAQTTEHSSASKPEHDALLAAAKEIRKLAKKGDLEDGPQPQVVGGEHGKGRRKWKLQKTAASADIFLKEDDVNENMVTKSDESIVSVSVSENEIQKTEIEQAVNGGLHKDAHGSSSINRAVLRKHNEGVESTLMENAKPVPPVHFYALESDQHILDLMNPTVVIVYHADMTFVREIEIYKAENPSKKLKVYFLFYEDSTEVQKFEASIRRENGAFETLIRQKSLMMLPVDQDGHGLGLNSSVELQATSSQNLVTRKAGGRKETEKEMQVIVDMREFMSSLPNVLHQKGMRVIPVTLEVGDYILSPSICVERKSIQDLFLSFTSGRLYHQVETMSRYYRIPVLLIEFSQEKSFSFQSASEIGDDVTPNSIISKLSLLALHFPRLRIIWSRSLHATAEIFASLKSNQDEPDEAKAIRVGVPSEEGVVENDVRAENYNTSAVEFLRRLPGVTDSNYRALMDGCNSLAELALLPIERLAELMGGQKTARTLRDFLDAKYPTVL
ncbi:ERCC4 domain [Dillenia turbinata]|uniref:ERCC4 domain n=1 Tax=Dillenia turbinata TaxID=194707 RepID=A0AAN8WGF6_9MAGN